VLQLLPYDFETLVKELIQEQIEAATADLWRNGHYEEQHSMLQQQVLRLGRAVYSRREVDVFLDHLKRDLLEKIDHVQEACDQSLLLFKHDIERLQADTKPIAATEVVMSEPFRRETHTLADSLLVEVDSRLNALHAKMTSSVDDAVQHAYHHHIEHLHVSFVSFKTCIERSVTELEGCLDTMESLDHETAAQSVATEKSCQLRNKIRGIQRNLNQCENTMDGELSPCEYEAHVLRHCASDGRHCGTSEQIRTTM